MTKLTLAGSVPGSLTLLAILAAWLLREPPAMACTALGNAKAQGERCMITGNVLLERDIQRLPDKLTVGGHLTIRGTSLKTLPAGMIVEGNLTLYKTSIGQLPADLIVGGNLDTYAGFGSPAIRCGDIPGTVVIKGKRECTH